MNEDRVVALRQEGEIDDPLTAILKAGAKRLIAQAVEAEFEAFLDAHADLTPSDDVGGSFATGASRRA